MDARSLNNFDRSLNNDKESLIEYLMDNHGSELTNLAYTYVRDWGLAQEIIQDVFFRCYQNLEKFRGEASYKTWLYRITINRCHDELRKVSFRKMLALPLSAFFSLKSKTLSPEETLITRGEEEKLTHLILSLPAKYREVIILYYYSGLSTVEISELLDQNPKTIRTRLRRARQILKDRLEEVDNNEG